MDVACVLASFWVATQIRFADAPAAPAEVRINRIAYLSLVLLVTFLNYVLHLNRGFMRRRAVQELGVVAAYVTMRMDMLKRCGQWAVSTTHAK